MSDAYKENAVKKTISILALVALATLLPGRSEALSEAEYSSLLKSNPKIASLDKDLNREYKQAMGKFRKGAETPSILRDSQKKWLRNREQLIQRIMRDRGIKSRAEAVALLLESRVGYLHCIEWQQIEGSRKTYAWAVREELQDKGDDDFCVPFQDGDLVKYNEEEE